MEELERADSKDLSKNPRGFHREIEERREKAHHALMEKHSPEAIMERKRKELMRRARYEHETQEEHWVNEWIKYYRKIPKTGLNNTSAHHNYRYDRRCLRDGYKGEGYPTLPARMEKMSPTFLGPELPYYYLMISIATKDTNPEVLPRLRELNNKIIDALQNLYDNLDHVTIIKPDIVAKYKKIAYDLKLYHIKQSVCLGGIIEHKSPVGLLEEG